MQSPRLLVALKLSVLVVLLTAAHASPMVGPPAAASAAEVTTSALLAPPFANGASAGATPTPVADVFFEGTLVIGGLEEVCISLQTASGEVYLLAGDLQGFGIGDPVGVWGNLCPLCVSVCLVATPILEVKGIIGLGPVGGIAELPAAAGTPLETVGSSGPSAGVMAGVAAAGAASAVALGGAAWYVRRRA